jgi:hypothetical protein
MASLHEFVSLSGRLVGNGRDESCTVYAQKVSLPGTEHYDYARATITDEPKDLPDGFYTVTFDDRTLKVQRLDGGWIASG